MGASREKPDYEVDITDFAGNYVLLDEHERVQPPRAPVSNPRLLAELKNEEALISKMQMEIEVLNTALIELNSMRNRKNALYVSGAISGVSFITGLGLLIGDSLKRKNDFRNSPEFVAYQGASTEKGISCYDLFDPSNDSNSEVCRRMVDFFMTKGYEACAAALKSVCPKDKEMSSDVGNALVGLTLIFVASLLIFYVVKRCFSNTYSAIEGVKRSLDIRYEASTSDLLKRFKAAKKDTEEAAMTARTIPYSFLKGTRDEKSTLNVLVKNPLYDKEVLGLLSPYLSPSAAINDAGGRTDLNLYSSRVPR